MEVPGSVTDVSFCAGETGTFVAVTIPSDPTTSPGTLLVYSGCKDSSHTHCFRHFLARSQCACLTIGSYCV